LTWFRPRLLLSRWRLTRLDALDDEVVELGDGTGRQGIDIELDFVIVLPDVTIPIKSAKPARVPDTPSQTHVTQRRCSLDQLERLHQCIGIRIRDPVRQLLLLRQRRYLDQHVLAIRVTILSCVTRSSPVLLLGFPWTGSSTGASILGRPTEFTRRFPLPRRPALGRFRRRPSRLVHRSSLLLALVRLEPGNLLDPSCNLGLLSLELFEF